MDGAAGPGSAAVVRAEAGTVPRHDPLALLAPVLAPALDQVRHGDPVLLVVQGPACSGRTTVLDALAHAVSAAGARVLRAAAGPSTRREPGGLLPQLGSCTREGLLTQVRAAAREAPVALLVDDVPWADDRALHALHLLVRAGAGLPLLVAVGTWDRPTGRALPDGLAGLPRARALPVGPWGEAALADLLARTAPAEVPHARAWWTATGGRPGVLRAALADPRPCPDRPGTAAVAALTALAAARGAAALELLRVAALVDAPVPDGVLTGVAGVPPEDEALADLRASALLDEHGRVQPPLLRTALLRALPPEQRSRLAREAARRSTGSQQALPLVGRLLLLTEPGDDLWVVEALSAAARGALERGEPAAAHELLARAVREPVAYRSSGLLRELGRSALLLGSPAAADALRAAVASADGDAELVGAALLLASALAVRGQVPEALAALTAARSRLQDPAGQEAVRLDMEAVAVARLDLRTSARADALLAEHARWSGRRPVDRLVLAHLCLEPVRSGSSAQEAVELAHQALEGGLLHDEQGPEAQLSYLPVVALGHADRVDEALELVEDLGRRAAARGSVVGRTRAAAFTALLAVRSGDLPRVLAAGRAAREAGVDPAVSGRYALAALTEALVAAGQVEAAARLWEDAGEEEPSVVTSLLLCSRGSLRLAQGRAEEAVLDLRESGRQLLAWGAPGPGWWPWRSRLARALAAVGEDGRALAEEERERARRYGSRRAEGIALRALARVVPARERLPLLEEAVAVLESGPDALELAGARVDLGAALARSGRLLAARRELERGADGARRCGAPPLHARAAAELSALPGHRLVLPGSALTAAERRTAALAAAGRTNRQIADELFVTVKTVETHLAHAYRKLGVQRRAELAAALAAQEP